MRKFQDEEYQRLYDTLHEHLYFTHSNESGTPLLSVNQIGDHTKRVFSEALNRDLAVTVDADTLFYHADHLLTVEDTSRQSVMLDLDMILFECESPSSLMKVSLTFWRMKSHWYCSIDLNLIAVLSGYRDNGVGRQLVELGFKEYVNPLIIACVNNLLRQEVKFDLVFQADYLNPASKKLGQLAFECLQAIDIELSARSHLVDINEE